MELRRLLFGVLLGVAWLMGSAGVVSDADACEPRHKLKLIEGVTDCQPGQLLCDDDGTGNPQEPVADNCRECFGDSLCWASDCRTFGGKDKGQFAQFKKSGKGELEAIIMVVTNLTTGDTTTLVDQVSSPDCGQLIPAGELPCSTIYKVKNIKPENESKPPLCTWNNLDDVNTVTTTPKSAGVVLTDLNGKSCKAVRKAGGNYWLFYQDCCAPASTFGEIGDEMRTDTTLVIDDDGSCSTKTVRSQSEPEFFPTDSGEPCL